MYLVANGQKHAKSSQGSWTMQTTMCCEEFKELNSEEVEFKSLTQFSWEGDVRH